MAPWCIYNSCLERAARSGWGRDSVRGSVGSMNAELSRPDGLATVQSGRKQAQSRVCTPGLSIRGRSCGVANMMLLSHCGEYLANVKHLYSRHIRQKWYDCPGELLKKCGLSNGYECFRISHESLRISYEAYDQSAEIRVNPLRMVILLANVLRSPQMPCHQ